MRKQLKEALEANNIEKARGLLVEMMARNPGNVTVLEDIRETIEKTPGLFQADDGKRYAASADEMTETLIVALREDMAGNFSLQKYRLYAEVQARIKGDPAYYKGGTEVCAEVVDEVRRDGAPDGQASGSHRRRGAAVGRAVGFVVMLIGAIAAIVGICIPIKFMIGLGIGVLMLGSTVVYTAINRLDDGM